MNNKFKRTDRSVKSRHLMGNSTMERPGTSNEIKVYIKGVGQPGYSSKGAFGIIIVCDGRFLECSVSEENQTFVRMEMLSLIRALEYLAAEGRTIVFYSEFDMLVNAFQMHWIDNWAKGGWKKTNGGLQNRDLWKTIDELCFPMFVEFRRPEDQSDVDLIGRATHFAKMALNLSVIKDKGEFWPINPKTGIHMAVFDPHRQENLEEGNF